MRSDYGTEDDNSSYGGRNRNPSSFRTIHRYHIKTRQSGGSTDDQHSPRLETVPRSEYIDADRPYFIDDYDQCNSALELERERSRVRTVIRERVREKDDCKPRRRDSSRMAQATINDKKKVKERWEQPSELERYRDEKNYHHDRRSSTPPPIHCSPKDDQYQLVRGEKFAERDYELRLEAEHASSRNNPYRQEFENYNSSPRLTERPRRGIMKRTQYSHSDSECSDDEYEICSNLIDRDRSKSPNSHHKRHLVEGALAGAGVSALVSNRLEKKREKPEHAARNIISGAALGAVGAEVLTRARSQHRHKSVSRSRSRSTSRSSRHKLKKALGLAAAGIAATAAAQRAQSHKTNNDELSRGRSRTRSRTRRNSCFYAGDDVTIRSRSNRKESKKRSSAIAATGLATAAAAGLVQQVRKTSRNRNRSQSRLRSGAEIASAGLAGAVVASLLDKNKPTEKKEQKKEYASRRESNARSRTRARSRGRYSTSGSELELEMVQYGAEPVYANSSSSIQDGTGDYGSMRHRTRSHRGQRDCSRSKSRSRSPSHIKQIAGAVAGATVAALGLSQFTKRRETDKEIDCEKVRRQARHKSRSHSRHRNHSPAQGSLAKRRTQC